MMELPQIVTERLLLRALELNDAPAVQGLAGDRDIASTTMSIPYPCEDGMAEIWIAGHLERRDRDEAVSYAIVEKSSGALIGTVGLAIRPEHERAELGYWLGKPYWGRGYATEASQAVLRHGFETLGLNRVYANYFIRNPASGRVLEKLGMRYEGLARQHVKKWGVLEDLVTYGMLRSDYEALGQDAPHS